MKRYHSFPPDFIRAVSVISVLGVHVFLNTGFYETPCVGTAMTLLVLVRTQLMVCVPLFLLLTGYLQGRKSWGLGCYKGLGKFLGTYLLASVFCCLFRAVWLDGPWNPIEWLRGTLNFSAAPYAWYIEMYIGLFLFIPFLNAAWNGLSGEKARLALVGTMVLLSVAPSVNVVSEHFNWQAVPAFWESCYPLAYYYTGRLLAEKDLTGEWKVFLGLDILATLMGGFLHVYQAGGEPIGYLPLTYWGGIFTYLCAGSTFVVLLRLGSLIRSSVVKDGISLVGQLSLPIFLLSWIPDQLVYPILCQWVPEGAGRVPWMVVTVPIILAGSLMLSLLLIAIQSGIARFASRLLRNV